MRTALDLTPDERRQYLDAARRRMTRPPGSGSDPAAVQLKTRFGARRVILFGSWAHAAWDAAESDVDLAVEGLSGQAYWQAWAALEELFPDRVIDLVALEGATDALRSAIQRGGREL
jgi:predicted nucleotidyltransferase